MIAAKALAAMAAARENNLKLSIGPHFAST